MNNENRQNCIETFDKIKEKIPALEKITDKKATDSEIVYPILQSLGWDILDRNQVVRDYQYNLDNPKTIDYALMSDRKPVLYVEVKPASNELTLTHQVELIKLCRASNIKFSVLTNGLVWNVYYLEDEDYEHLVRIEIQQFNSSELYDCFNVTLSREAIVSETAIGAIQIERTFDCFRDVFSYLLVEDPEFSERVRSEIQNRYDLKLSAHMVDSFLAEVEEDFQIICEQDSTYEE